MNAETNFMKEIASIFNCETKEEKIHGKFLYKGNDYIKNNNIDSIFLWNADNAPIYIMDNHRCALWCWEQELNSLSTEPSKIHLLHIDRHSDGADFQENVKNVSSGINEYIANELITWDNYISYFMQLHPDTVKKTDFSNENKPIRNWKTIFDYLDNKIDLNNNELLIVNFDLDACFTSDCKIQKKGREHLISLLGRMKSFIRKYSSQIVITIALSPTCCYGQNTLNKLVTELKIIERELNLNIDLWDCLASCD